MKSALAAFVAGLVFAVGLAISGMTQPGKVTAFLDFFGNWDPSLALVMMGAIAVHATLYRLIRQRSTPLFTATFSVSTRSELDPRLIGGAVLFGTGWGLAGFCPGPAVTSLASGHTSVITFVAAMLAGMFLYKLVDRARAPPISPSSRHELQIASSTTPAFENPQDA